MLKASLRVSRLTPNVLTIWYETDPVPGNGVATVICVGLSTLAIVALSVLIALGGGLFVAALGGPIALGAVLGLAALAVSCLGCRRQKVPQNFILITLDTLRADHVSAYSLDHSLTPNLDLLARQGIGMLPLATFARSEEGFDTARRTFRLTLGGTDRAEVLANKTRRVLIDLNRIVAEESANYNRRTPAYRAALLGEHRAESLRARWKAIEAQITRHCGDSGRVRRLFALPGRRCQP
jgi:hypothetical protein